jgi:DNA-binding XRE family transcriptional regulator
MVDIVSRGLILLLSSVITVVSIGDVMKANLRSETIKRILLRKNKTQNWLAHRLEISTGYMSQLMEGTRNPSPKLREKIMNYLPDLGFDDLFEMKEMD